MSSTNQMMMGNAVSGVKGGAKGSKDLVKVDTKQSLKDKTAVKPKGGPAGSPADTDSVTGSWRGSSGGADTDSVTSSGWAKVDADPWQVASSSAAASSSSGPARPDERSPARWSMTRAARWAKQAYKDHQLCKCKDCGEPDHWRYMEQTWNTEYKGDVEKVKEREGTAMEIDDVKNGDQQYKYVHTCTACVAKRDKVSEQQAIFNIQEKRASRAVARADKHELVNVRGLERDLRRHPPGCAQRRHSLQMPVARHLAHALEVAIRHLFEEEGHDLLHGAPRRPRQAVRQGLAGLHVRTGELAGEAGHAQP